MDLRVVALGLGFAVMTACSGGSGASDATPTVATPTVSVIATTVTSTSTAAPIAPETPSEPVEPPPAPTYSEPPPGSGPSAVVARGPGDRRAAVLTFDAGSDAGYTAQILDTLAANGVTAAFGITGRWAEENPSLLRRIVDGGHTLINHTYDHASFTGFSTGAAAQTQAQRWSQLDRTESIIGSIAGATTFPYFRPPFGDYDASVNADVGARGYAYNVMWTVDSRGWQGLPAAAIVDRCLDLAEPGAIYVFHVGSASQDGPALQGIIDGLRGMGYELAPLEAFAP